MSAKATLFEMDQPFGRVPRKDRIRTKPRPQQFTEEQVEAIYEAYPRHVGRQAAITAIVRALTSLAGDDPAQELLERVKEYAASPAGNKGAYTPHPATWFSQKRYLDDPKEWER